MIKRNTNVHGLYRWMVRYTEAGWYKTEYFKTREEAVEFERKLKKKKKTSK